MIGVAAASSTTRPRWAGAGALLVAALVLVAFAAFWAVDPDLGVFWGIGIAFGIILQRSRLCFAGAFRDLFLAHDGRLLRGLIVAMMGATVGFWLLMARLVPDPSFGTLPPGAHVTPVGLHLVVGGVLFGLGMVLAGGCVSGTLFRIGEGYVASMVALLGILGGLSLAAHTWNWWWTTHIAAMPLVWLPGLVGHWWALVGSILALAAVYLVVVWWEMREGPPPPPPPDQPLPPAFSVGDHLRALSHRIVVRGWPAWAGAVALAMLNVFAFIYDHPLGVTGELSAWAERLTGLVGLSAGPLLGVDLFAGCNLAVGDGGWLTSAFTLDAGLIVGAFLAALASSEFKLRTPRRPARYLQAIGGGVLMGYGAGIAVGCTIGAFFSAIPSLALNGWVFGVSLAAGAFLGTLIIRRLP
ncbi:MAG: YeeE/YedE family protein [Dehalococcoidia bacterium]|nr:YeeE/YedE family protein [Dehalococcoidia bacterium]